MLPARKKTAFGSPKPFACSRRRRHCRQELGKRFITGEVKKIDETKLTILRPDGESQVIEVDEGTSFRNQKRESITLADIKAGDHVFGRGEVKNGVFVPQVLNLGDFSRMGRPGFRGYAARLRTAPRPGRTARMPGGFRGRLGWTTHFLSAVSWLMFPGAAGLHGLYLLRNGAPALRTSGGVQLLIAALALGGFPVAAQQTQASEERAAPARGFHIRGIVKSGNTPLPGVTVTAANSLTGKKAITSTDVDGSYSLELSGRGRYVVRAEMTAFASATQEVVLNASSPEQQANFSLVLLSRAPKPEQPGPEASAAAGTLVRDGRGTQRLSLSVDDSALRPQAAAELARQASRPRWAAWPVWPTVPTPPINRSRLPGSLGIRRISWAASAPRTSFAIACSRWALSAAGDSDRDSVVAALWARP